MFLEMASADAVASAAAQEQEALAMAVEAACREAGRSGGVRQGGRERVRCRQQRLCPLPCPWRPPPTHLRLGVSHGRAGGGAGAAARGVASSEHLHSDCARERGGARRWQRAVGGYMPEQDAASRTKPPVPQPTASGRQTDACSPTTTAPEAVAVAVADAVALAAAVEAAATDPPRHTSSAADATAEAVALAAASRAVADVVTITCTLPGGVAREQAAGARRWVCMRRLAGRRWGT